jgi:hypothetical protein
LLDGVIVQDSDNYGILGIDVDFEVSNCVVEENENFGIWAENGDVSIKWCSIKNNGYDGIHHLDGETSLAVENCQIIRNSRNGIYDANSVPTFRNNVICGNGVEDVSYFGIRIWNPCAPPVLLNNTIAYNYNAGFAYSTDNDPNHDNLPDILNCIIWYNNDNGEQFAGYKPPRHYSCIYDPNYPDGTNETIDSNGNFSHKPDFAYPYSDDPNVLINVHLAYDSLCKDKGNPSLPYEGQTDIDNENRVADSVVDVGADEIHCDQISNVLDWDADGIVNLNEFRKFSDVWLAHDPNDPAVLDPNNPVNDPNSPSYIKPEQLEAWYPDGWKLNFSIEEDSAYSIDVADLLVFLEDAPWLWVACWRTDIQEMQQQMMQQSMMMNSGLTTKSISTLQSEPVLTETSSVQTVEPLVVQNVKSVPIQESPIEPVQPEKSIAEQIADLQEAIQFLESIGSDPNTQFEIQALDWQEFMDEVRNSLTELQKNDTITQDKVED